MTFGAFIPYLLPRTTSRKTFLEWCERIDNGPFHCIAHGERTRWHTLEHVTTLAAMAVVTSRVRIWSFTFNLPMHPVAFLAKRVATIDVLSEGRYTMTAAIGGRPQDWLASERPYVEFPHAQMDKQIHELRRIWSGLPPADGGDLIFPLPVQQGGPPILCSSQGPKGLARAAHWADGYGGFVSEFCDGPEKTLELLTIDAQRVRAAWQQAGRTDEPHLSVGCFYGLGNGARERLADISGSYRKNRNAAVTGGEFWVHNAEAVLEIVRVVREAGFQHINFIPTNDDIGELDELAGIIGGLTSDDSQVPPTGRPI